MILPEAPLWAMLDQIGLPFRETAGDLVAGFGTRPCLWSEGHRECHIPCPPLIPGLSEFSFNVTPGDDPTLPPDWFSATCRQASFRLTDALRDQRAARNQAHLAAAVARHLGPGQDVSASNTHATEWRFGLARAEVLAFPPHLNTHFAPNQRHDLDPGSEHEASLILNPGYLPPLGPEALHRLADFAVLGQALPLLPSPWFAPPRWHRWPQGLGAEPAPAFGLSRDGAGFVVVSQGLAKVIPRADLTGLERVFLRPAKGPGGVTLSLRHAPAGLAGVRAQSVLLMQADPTPDALLAEAERLAAALDLPLVQIEDADC